MKLILTIIAACLFLIALILAPLFILGCRNLYCSIQATRRAERRLRESKDYKRIMENFERARLSITEGRAK